MKSTLIIATVLVAALASGPALATKNTGSHIDSAEFNKAGGLCSVYAESFSNALKDMNKAKNKENRAAARETANWALGEAYDYGCSWVSSV